MIAILKVALLDLAFAALGRRLLRLGRLNLEAGEEIGFAFVLGAGATGLLTLGAGILGLLRPAVAWCLVLAPLVVCRADVRAVLEQVGRGVKAAVTSSYPKLARAMLIVLFINVALNVFAALAPPTGTDTLSARLAIPKAYVEAGQILYLPSNLHANLPGNGEMLYTLCMLLGSDRLAQLVHLSFGLSLLLGIYGLAARRFSHSLAALACLLFYSLTDVVAQFSAAYTDLAVAAFAFYAFAAWVRWWEGGDGRSLALAGVCAGMAAGSKLNALGVLATLLIITAAASWRVGGNRLPRVAAEALWVLLPGVVVFLPWLLKNISMTGNPLYPLFAGVLGGRALTPAESSFFFTHAMRNSAIRRGFADFLELPWEITMFGPYTSGTIGPLFLMVLPFVPWLRPWPPLFRPITWFAVPFVALWYWGSPFVRFALVLLALLSVVTAWGLQQLSRANPYGRAICYGFAGLWFVAATGNNVRVYEVTFPVQLGLETREEYLRRVLPIRGAYYYFDDLEWMNAHLPLDAKVLSWTWSNYYLERPWIFLGRLHAYADTRAVESPQTFLETLRRLGVSHLMVVDGLEESQHPPVPRANEFVERLASAGALRETRRRAAVHVYELCPTLSNDP